MGQNQSYQYQLIPNNTEIKPSLEKTVFPQELAAELEAFYHDGFTNWTCYKFITETSGKTSCKYDFYRYEIYVSDKPNVFKKNGIYIIVYSGYRGINGSDYKRINADKYLSDNNLINKWSDDHVSIDGLYNIDCINHKFIDLVKDYQPVLYKLLLWLKTGK